MLEKRQLSTFCITGRTKDISVHSIPEMAARRVSEEGVSRTVLDDSKQFIRLGTLVKDGNDKIKDKMSIKMTCVARIILQTVSYHGLEFVETYAASNAIDLPGVDIVAPRLVYEIGDYSGRI